MNIRNQRNKENGKGQNVEGLHSDLFFSCFSLPLMSRVYLHCPFCFLAFVSFFGFRLLATVFL